jgi:hypothetical protein
VEEARGQLALATRSEYWRPWQPAPSDFIHVCVANDVNYTRLHSTASGRSNANKSTTLTPVPHILSIEDAAVGTRTSRGLARAS